MEDEGLKERWRSTVFRSCWRQDRAEASLLVKSAKGIVFKHGQNFIENLQKLLSANAPAAFSARWGDWAVVCWLSTWCEERGDRPIQVDEKNAVAKYACILGSEKAGAWAGAEIVKNRLFGQMPMTIALFFDGQMDT